MIQLGRQILSPFEALLVLSLVANGLMLGFFYAWVCSTMWGLDAADPRVAISAMQAMNASVRNFAFGPVFFGTPFLLLVTALIGWRQGVYRTARLLGLAGVVLLFGYLVLTASINVPMNVALGQQIVPQETEAAQLMWNNYSQTWQFWNTTRFIATGIGFILAVYASVIVLPNERLALREQVQ
ncbi:DUF1772 domain-containing protein [Maritalea porphyrae]|uniref:anthrone oxygenase family protein n=1 Tax=Maritalea porphyrae TaxID=880732 RepID=UPI0022AF1C8E|nr:anthrone oxygenase family protein [Maritalea porphyrae]MCZ4272357.1 DUF1772 domain-containing protein [Maritalea porphyrae]